MLQPQQQISGHHLCLKKLPEEKLHIERLCGLQVDELQTRVGDLRGGGWTFTVDPCILGIQSLNAKNKLQELQRKPIILKHSYQNTKNRIHDTHTHTHTHTHTPHTPHTTLLTH